MGGGLLAVVAALLPWATLNTIFGSLSRNGIDNGGDGLFTAALGIIGALALWQAGRWLWAAGISGGLIVAIGIYDISDVRNMVSDVNAESEGYASASVGSGLYLTVLAGVILVGVSFLQIGRGRKDGTEAATGTDSGLAMPPPSNLPPPPPPSTDPI